MLNYDDYSNDELVDMNKIETHGQSHRQMSTIEEMEIIRSSKNITYIKLKLKQLGYYWSARRIKQFKRNQRRYSSVNRRKYTRIPFCAKKIIKIMMSQENEYHKCNKLKHHECINCWSVYKKKTITDVCKTYNIDKQSIQDWIFKQF